MRIQDEHRTGADRRRSDSTGTPPLGIDRRWAKDQRSHLIDENEVFGRGSVKTEGYWETLFNIPSEDAK
ncbi:MAG: hypothetical protein QM739_17595 [Propionivibrio sp.]